MSSDLIALIVAIALGLAVVVLGLRRNLSDTTRSGLPRFETDPEGATPNLGLYAGEGKHSRPPSPRHMRWLVLLYLPLGLTFAAYAVLSAHDRLLHASLAGLYALTVVILLRRASSQPADGPAS